LKLCSIPIGFILLFILYFVGGFSFGLHFAWIAGISVM